MIEKTTTMAMIAPVDSPSSDFPLAPASGSPPAGVVAVGEAVGADVCPSTKTN